MSAALHRDKLVEAHGRLDPLIGELIRNEMRERWWWYLLVSVPLGWCGMWVGGLPRPRARAAVRVRPASRAVRRSKPLFLLYAAPPLVMLALHAAVANHYTRYNLILIGPFAAGAAWMIARMTASLAAAPPISVRPIRVNSRRDDSTAPSRWRSRAPAR